MRSLGVKGVVRGRRIAPPSRAERPRDFVECAARVLVVYARGVFLDLDACPLDMLQSETIKNNLVVPGLRFSHP